MNNFEVALKVTQFFPFMRKKERQYYMQREEYQKTERETLEEREKRRTQPCKPAPTLNEIMTKRGETPSEITQKFVKWVRKKILNDKKCCGMEIRVAACNWPDYDYVPKYVPTIYTLCYRGNGISPVEKNTFMEVMGAKEKEVKCKFIKDFLTEINLRDFQAMMLEEDVVCGVYAAVGWGIVITIYPRDLAENKNPSDLRTELKRRRVPII